MRQLEEFFEKAKLVEKLERGGVDCVAAEVAEEVCVFFQDRDGDALTGEKKAEHHACGAAADDAAGGGERVFRWTHGGLRVASAGNGVKRNRDLGRVSISEGSTSAAKAAAVGVYLRHG